MVTKSSIDASTHVLGDAWQVLSVEAENSAAYEKNDVSFPEPSGGDSPAQNYSGYDSSTSGQESTTQGLRTKSDSKSTSSLHQTRLSKAQRKLVEGRHLINEINVNWAIDEIINSMKIYDKH